MLQTQHADLFTPRAIYDGAAVMFSTNAQLHGQTLSLTVGNGPRKITFTVRITRVAAIRSSEIQQLVSPNRQGGHNISALSLLQHIVRQAPNLTHKPLKRNAYYAKDGEKPLNGGLMIWKGFFQSVRPVVNRLLINIDVSSAVVYRQGNLFTVAMEFLKVRSPRDAIAQLENPVRWAKLTRFLKNVLIKPEINTPGNWTNGKKIAALVERAGHEEFTDGNNTRWTIQDYFRRKYNKPIQFPDSFGVRIGSTAIFPAELCSVLPGQLYRRRLDEDQQRNFVQESAINPFKRLEAITGAVQGRNQVFNYHRSDFMSSMAVNPNPEVVQGVILPDPQLQFGDGQKTIRYGKWNVAHSKYQTAKKIENMAAITFVRDSMNHVKGLIHKLLRTLNQRGATILCDSAGVVVVEGKAENVQQSFKILQERVLAAKGGKPTFILIVLPSSAAALKQQVKYAGNVITGIATQCVRAGKYETANDQYLNNVALKINAKIGGVNSLVSPGVMGLKGLNTMVVGCDVSHPGPGANRPSIASLVAAVDNNVTLFTSFIAIQPPRVEIIDNIGDMLQRAIDDYRDYHNKPCLQHVVVYRDGVSEGEYAQVQQEIDQIKARLEKYPVLPSEKPKLTFIVVTKRHHVRFFPSRELAQDRTLKDNCPAGLVVDDGVVQNDWPNFYLQSHSGLQGTSCPSHYIVLNNDYNWPMADLQQLSYSLCYSYASATRSVSIPAPVYYADRACGTADWLFDSQKIDLSSETGSTVSGELDLNSWGNALQVSRTNKRLYFL